MAESAAGEVVGWEEAISVAEGSEVEGSAAAGTAGLAEVGWEEAEAAREGDSSEAAGSAEAGQVAAEMAAVAAAG